MSTTTGATDEQIEAAAAIAWNDTGATVPITDMDEDNRFVRERRADALLWASRLVPPGMVIASAADVAKVPTAEELDAMREALEVLCALSNAGMAGDEWVSEFLQELWTQQQTSVEHAIDGTRAYLERVTG